VILHSLIFTACTANDNLTLPSMYLVRESVIFFVPSLKCATKMHRIRSNTYVIPFLK
jgi:hypothetical protein